MIEHHIFFAMCLIVIIILWCSSISIFSEITISEIYKWVHSFFVMMYHNSSTQLSYYMISVCITPFINEDSCFVWKSYGESMILSLIYWCRHFLNESLSTMISIYAHILTYISFYCFFFIKIFSMYVVFKIIIFT